MTWLKPRGPDILTGGSFGPDGGLIETAVVVAGIALLLAYRARLVENAPQDPLTS